MSQPKPYYITTPIYYVTDKPHIGHLYTTTATDIMARYQRLLGRDVRFLTGTDEHGQKMQKKAKEVGLEPQQLADKVVVNYQDAWKKYGITHDDFIRTTEERHKKVVIDYLAKLLKTGDVYLGSYEGWYCVPDESFWTDTQIVDGKCPECGRSVEKLKEESYFFKMSKYGDRLLQHIKENPDFIIPETRKNEVVSFVEMGLKDISISRTTIDWGIPMPEDGKASRPHKVYVWFDALTNYISALGPLEPPGPTNLFDRYWKDAIHVVGKDILRFHAVYWPTFLMALDLPIPKQIVAHGWLMDSNRKIGKSLGNAVDPMALADTLGIDAIRYFLFREFVFGQDGEYTEETLYRRINSDLANDYGNGVSRVSSMMLKYLGADPIDRSKGLGEGELASLCEKAIPLFHQELEKFGFHKALEQLWKILTGVNRFIEAQAPWKLAKSDKAEDKAQLAFVLIQCHEALRLVSLLLHPFMPTATQTALDYLGDTTSLKQPAPLTNLTWGTGPAQVTITKPKPLFPRTDLPK